VKTLLNVVFVAGLFWCAYLTAWWLISMFGAPSGQSLAADLDYGYEHDAIPEWDHRPTDAEWREWQRMLDDEAQDGRDDR
jgi:hypothetical protein